MAVSYPATWVARVERAEKLVLDSSTGVYRSPDGAQEVSTDAVLSRTDTYLKAEIARRKKRLNRDEERICRDFVLLVANWRTGAWERREEATRPARTSSRPRTKSAG